VRHHAVLARLDALLRDWRLAAGDRRLAAWHWRLSGLRTRGTFLTCAAIRVAVSCRGGRGSAVAEVVPLATTAASAAPAATSPAPLAPGRAFESRCGSAHGSLGAGLDRGVARNRFARLGCDVAAGISLAIGCAIASGRAITLWCALARRPATFAAVLAAATLAASASTVTIAQARTVTLVALALGVTGTFRMPRSARMLASSSVSIPSTMIAMIPMLPARR
jgi:hypothetical protein